MEYRFYHICIDQVQQILLIIYNNLFFVISLIKETFPQITDLWPNEIFLDIFETRTICISSSVQKWEYIPPWITELFKSKTSHASKRSVIFNNGNKSRVYDTCIPKFPLSKKKKKKRKKGYIYRLRGNWTADCPEACLQRFVLIWFLHHLVISRQVSVIIFIKQRQRFI